MPDDPHVYAPIPEMEAALATLRREEPAVVERALTLIGAHLTSEAQADGVVPFKTGFLQSAHTYEVDRDRRLVELQVNAAYAQAVHEKHPSRKRWMLRTIIAQGPKAVENAIKAALGGA